MLNISKYSNQQYIYSQYVQPTNGKGIDTLMVKTRYIDGHGKSVPNMLLLQAPTRDIFVTKPDRRVHQFKKAFAPLTEVDRYTVEEKSALATAYKVLKGYLPRHIDNRRLFDIKKSPYVYGLDIDVNTIYKEAFMRQYEEKGLPTIPLETDFLDIETSIIDGAYYKKPIIISVTAGKKVYTAVLRHFLTNKKGNGFYTKEDIYNNIQKGLAEHIEKLQLEIEVEIFSEPYQLVLWIFDKINTYKSDFVGVWNIGFDIPTMLDTLVDADIPVESICAKDIPDYLRHVTYKQDNSKSKQKSHIADKWHLFDYGGHTKFIDSMCLYSRLRTASGKMDYSLNSVLTKELGLRKLYLSPEGGHYEMQTSRFLDYIVYNIFDVLGPKLLEEKNHDITNMNVLLGTTMVNKFNAANTINKNDLYFYLLKHKKMVLGTAVGSLANEYTKRIKSKGGLVLSTGRVIDIGANVIEEDDKLETGVLLYLNDLDFKSYYPMTEIGLGISPECKLSSLIGIEGIEKAELVEKCINTFVSTKENAVVLGKQVFGLPNYNDMYKEVTNRLVKLKE